MFRFLNPQPQRNTSEPFEDEIHPRLRFVHRVLVGMANNGMKNSNDSQFFITLSECPTLSIDFVDEAHPRLSSDRADELNGKHTLFGRIVGDTFFSESLPQPTHL